MSNLPKSKPVFSQLRITCPRCNYNNVATITDKPGAEVVCGGCYHTFIVGE